MAGFKDITNQIFGSLVVLERSGLDSVNNVLWKCLCSCGNTQTINGSLLRTGRTIKCSICYDKERTNNLTGQIFGKLLVQKQASKIEVENAGFKSNLESTHWHCLCSCGNTQIFRGTSLSRVNYQQCSICAKKYRSEQCAIKNRKSYVGIKNNDLEIIADLDERDAKGNWLCLAKCTCGTEIKRPGVFIQNGNTKSCGCLKITLSARAKTANKARRQDLTGQIFTYLTALEYDKVVYKDNYYFSQWKCKCICGNVISVKTTYLTQGEVTSCGCKTKERLSLAQGGTGIPYEHKSIQDTLRGLPIIEQWKKQLFSLHDYTCQMSNIKGCNLNVHHIIPLNVLVSTHGITKDNYLDYSDVLFDTGNGIVISEELHQQFHAKYGHNTDYYDLLEFNSCLQGLS